MNQTLKQTSQQSDKAPAEKVSTLVAPSAVQGTEAEAASSTAPSASMQVAMATEMASFDEQSEATRAPLDAKVMASGAVERFHGGDALNGSIARHWAASQAEGTDKGDFYKLPHAEREAVKAAFFAESHTADTKKDSTSPVALQQVKRAYLDASKCAGNAERQIKKSGVEDTAVIQSAMQGATFASLAVSYYENNGFSKYGAERVAETGKFPSTHEGMKALEGLRKNIEKKDWTADVKKNALANVDWFGKALDSATTSGDQKATAAIAGLLIALEAANWAKHPFTKPQTLGGIRSQVGAKTPEEFGTAIASKFDAAKYDATKGDKADWIKPDATYKMRQLFFKDGINAPGAKAPDAQNQEA